MRRPLLLLLLVLTLLPAPAALAANGYGPRNLPLVSRVWVADRYSCASDFVEALRCWGDTPGGFTAAPRVTALALGDRALCLTGSDRRVSCWGSGPVIEQPQDLGAVDLLAATDSAACAAPSGGALRCWGRGPLAAPPALTSVTALALASDHGCALDGAVVRCWGDNTHGQAAPPGDLPAVTALAVGARLSCARSSSGRVRCWGENTHGQASPPAGLDDAFSIQAQPDGACALRTSATLSCWGTLPSWGQYRDVAARQLVTGFALSARSLCARTAEAVIYCSGSDAHGQLTGRLFSRLTAAPPLQWRARVLTLRPQDLEWSGVPTGEPRFWQRARRNSGPWVTIPRARTSRYRPGRADRRRWLRGCARAASVNGLSDPVCSRARGPF